MRNQLVKSLFLVSFVFYSVPVWSLGLGDARVESFIGQPLLLHIELITSPGDDLDSVTARLASADDFALVGASRGSISVPLTFRISQSDDGATVLVQSRGAFSDPVLRLVVEVTWSSGRMLREYTVLLDPPTVPAQAPRAPTSQVAPTPTPPPAASQETIVEEPGQSVSEVAEISAPQPDPVTDAGDSDSTEQTESSRADTYGPIRSGETLWRIASDWAGNSDMNMSQVMLAIQRKNPDAFMRDNINLLKRGAELEMPSEEEVDEINAVRARELVAQQEAAFRMRSSMAATSTPLIAPDTGETLSAPTPASSTPEPLQEEIARLEIVPPSEADLAGEPGTGAVPDGAGSEEVARDLRESLARTEEELFSERQQNTYLRERIAELEAQLGDGEGDTTPGVSDTEFAQFQERLESERLEEESGADGASEEPEADLSSPEIPTVLTTQSTEETPWYNRGLTRLIMIVIVVAAIGGWLFSRRRSYDDYDTDLEQLGASTVDEPQESVEKAVVSHAEGVERARADSSLADELPETPAEREDDWGITFEGEPDEEPQLENDVEVVSLENARRKRDDGISEATVLDENSTDPEIKLDLARAYISMGDKEAARVILNEVLSIGSEPQQEEARSMLNEL